MNEPTLADTGEFGVIGAVTRFFPQSDAVLVHEDGKPIGVLTRQDLLTFVAAS